MSVPIFRSIGKIFFQLWQSLELFSSLNRGKTTPAILRLSHLIVSDMAPREMRLPGPLRLVAVLAQWPENFKIFSYYVSFLPIS